MADEAQQPSNLPAKRKQLPEAARKALAEIGIDVQPGDFVISHDGSIYRVGKIKKGDYGRWCVSLDYRTSKDWGHYGDIEFARFKREFFKLNKPYAQVEADALAALANVDALDPYESEETPEDNQTTALILGNDKAYLEHLKQRREAQIRQLSIIEAVLARKRNHLQHIARKMQKEVAKVMRAIGAIETYLGVYEEITQIAEGQRAHVSAPISIRQAVLYMDEECGDPRPKAGEQRGIDWQSIEDFDAWIVKPENLARVLPEQRGIVAMKPSRQHRQYAEDIWLNAKYNAGNRMVYILIRNGGNLYRIWTGSDEVTEKLFPGPDELAKTLKEAELSWDQERAEDIEFGYKRNALLLQGLIDRTEILQPLPHAVNFFNPDTYGSAIALIYDAELALPTGRLPFREWHKRINAEIHQGSRIVIADYYRGDIGILKDSWDRSYYFLRYYSGNHPKLPAAGVYTVEKILPPDRYSHEECLVIYYQPGGTVYSDWGDYEGHARKNRVGFKIRRSDWWALNYDAISLEDVEWYLNCRTDRENYLNMIPTLWRLRDERLAEIEFEKDFVALVAGRQGCPESEVWEALEWWKLKNKWKRGLHQEEALALRMIERRIERNREGGTRNE